MQAPVILSACRTPIGKFRGALSTLSAIELGASAIRSALNRATVEPEQVDEVIMGNVLAASLGQAPARQAAIGAGLPPAVAALTINKVCGSSLKAVMLAAQAIRCGDAEVVVAGGMESMSRAPYLLPRESTKAGHRTMYDSMLLDGLTCPFSSRSMGEIAESLARSDGITRARMDAYAAESHRRALRARDQGFFVTEIEPLTLQTRGAECTVSEDEGPRREATFEQLKMLPPTFADGGAVTAGNASMISDGAATLVIASQAFAARHQLRPLARIVAMATSGTPPEDLFIAPVTAVQQVIQSAGIDIESVDLFEINEAFAAQMLACLARLQLPSDRVNLNGGAIALGHPIGASGARVATTLLHLLRRRELRYGIAALCLGGGNAVAMLFEREVIDG